MLTTDSMTSLVRRGGFQFFSYSPSMGAAVVFIVLFSLTTLLHTYQGIRTRVRFFIAFLLGGYCAYLKPTQSTNPMSSERADNDPVEVIGYIARAVACHQTPNWTIGPYIVNSVLPLVAPALFAASIYMELGRIIIILDAQAYSLIKVGWLTRIFVTGDVISFLMQASGGGLMGAGTQSGFKTGSNVVVGGLVIQIVFFGCFMLSSVLLHFRILRRPTMKSCPEFGIPWQKHMYTLYVASVLILIRSIYRLIENVEGFDGYLISHEVFLYVFDALMMFAVMVLFHVVHPSELNVLLYSGGIVCRGLRFQRVRGEVPVAQLEELTSAK